MSAYWAGYYGTALILSEAEYFKMVEAYAHDRGIDEDALWGELEEMSLREYEFLKGNWNAYPEDNRCFSVVDILTDNCDGMALTPFVVNGHPNIADEEYCKEYTVKDLRYHDAYAVFADKAMDGPMTLFGPPAYASYSELLSEFKDKLEKYLPWDFDWDGHIGRFRYAAYA